MATSDTQTGVESGIDEAQAKAGAAIDEAGRRVRSEARSFADKADAARSDAKDVLGRAADQARAAAATAVDTYADIRRRAQAMGETVDPFVRESPYAAIAVSALVGVVIGLLLFGGGAKVIYVKPGRD